MIATGLADDEDTLRGFGADEVVDFGGDIAAAVRESYPGGVDGLIDLASDGPTLSALADVVSAGGRLASASYRPPMSRPWRRGISAQPTWAYIRTRKRSHAADYV